MKDNKFEDYNQKGSIKESLNIKKEENNSPFSDSFVFKKEENKITWTNEYCSDGKEVNSNLTKLNNGQEEKQPELDQEKLQSSVSSTTAKIGTAVTTTAAVVTTAVVAVVGIDLVTTELVDELPQICEISEVVTTSETISFVLNIGNDEDEAYAEEPGAECNLVVELTCEKYDDVQELPVKNFGTFEGEFTGLREETNYSINVYQPSFLYLERRYLMVDSYSASTEKGFRNNISLEIETDPLGTDIYYSTIDYKDTLGIHLYDFRLHVYNDDPSANSENIEMMGFASLDSADPYSRQKLQWSYFHGVNAAPYFALMATTDDEEYIATHVNNNTSGRPEDERDIILYSQQINIEELPRPQMRVSENRIFVQRIQEESPSTYYHRFYFATPEAEGSYDELTLSITNTRDESNVSSSMHTAGTTKAMNTPLDMDLNFGSSGEYETFRIELKGVSHLQADVDEWNATHENPSSGPATVEGGVNVTICTETINFDTIETVIIPFEPQASITGFLTASSYFSESDLYVGIAKNDPGYHIQSMSIKINEQEYELEPYYGDLMENSVDEYYLVKGASALCNGVGNADVVLYGVSDYQMTYNRTQKVVLEETEEDFSDLEQIYYIGCLWLDYVSDGTGYTLNAMVNYGGTDYSYFYIVISNLDGSVLTIGDEEASFNVSQGNTTTSTNIPELFDRYEVTTYGNNGYYNVSLYTEIINFRDIQRSV